MSQLAPPRDSRAADGALAKPGGANLEEVLIKGDLSTLSDDQRLGYYKAVCESVGLNPLTKPFEYLVLKGKGDDKDRLVLYANKNCAEQLRRNNHVSIKIKSRELIYGLFMVTVEATMPDGRMDEAIGAVAIEAEELVWKENRQGKRYPERTGRMTKLSGEALANAMMKAETKAKRRVALSICGLGMPDESELEDIVARSQEPVMRVQEEPRALPGMEQDPELITPEQAGELKNALIVGGGLQKEFLAYLGVERWGLIPRRGYELVLQTAKKPKKDWPKPGLPGFAGSAEPLPGEPPASAGGEQAKPPPADAGGSPAKKTPPPPPCTVDQVERLKAQVKRLDMSPLDVSSLLQSKNRSRWEDLSEDEAEWLLEEFAAAPTGSGQREPGEDG